MDVFVVKVFYTYIAGLCPSYIQSWLGFVCKIMIINVTL